MGGTQNAINSLNILSSLREQAVMNGDFDVAQRGTSFTNPTSGPATLDRWKTAYIVDGGTLPVTVTISQQALTPGDIEGSFNFFRINVDGAGSGFGADALYRIQEFIEHGTRALAASGEEVTLSFWARSSIANKKLGVNLGQNYGTGGSPTAEEMINGTYFGPATTNILTSSWKKFTHTFTLNTLVGKTFGTDNNDTIKLRFYTMWGSTVATTVGDSGAESFVGSGNVDIARVRLSSGKIALDVQSKPFQEELVRCQRYYWKTFDYAVAPAQNSGSTNGSISYRIRLVGINTDGEYCKFPVSMRTAPSMTYFNPSAANALWRNATLPADSGTPASQCIGQAGLLVDNPQAAGDLVGGLASIHAEANAEF